MENEKVTIGELISRYISELKRNGYSEMTIWSYKYHRLGCLRKYYERTGHIYYDPDVTSEFVELMTQRCKNGEISNDNMRENRTLAHQLTDFYLSGQIRIYQPKHGTVYLLSEKNEHLIDEFILSMDYGNNTRDDVRWVVRKYLAHWEKLGYTSMELITIDEVQNFIFNTAKSVKVASLHNILLYLKQFHEYLKEHDIPAPDCVELFSYRVYRDMPIQSYVTDDELQRILDVIDTDTEGGKRNKAIILLGATTGLRAIDIIRMKLTDIDWTKGEIKIVQAKTGRTVYSPLLKETGEAIQDYILNARPTSTECQELFLRVLPPKIAIQDTTCINCMFRSYQKKAGIERQVFDGKSFHGLRRRLAKKLIVNGSSLSTIAQILGHDDIKSARQYLALNTDNLKECALDFQGISVRREALR